MKNIGICSLISLFLFNIIAATAYAQSEQEGQPSQTIPSGRDIDNLFNIDHVIDRVIHQVTSLLKAKDWKRIANVEIRSMGNSDDPQLEGYIIEQLTVRVNRLEGITVVEKGLFNQALVDLEGDFIDLANPGSETKFLMRRGLLKKMGELTHTDIILSGTITVSGGNATIVIGMIDVESGEIYRIKEENIYRIPNALLVKIAGGDKRDPVVLSKQGFYFGLGSTYTIIRGNLNGKVENANGFGAFVGYKLDLNWAFEFSSLDANHMGKWSGNSTDVHYNLTNYDVQYSPAIDWTEQPYLLIGVGLHEMMIGDATYGGTGLNLGVGVNHYSTPHLSIGARLTYHRVNYDTDNGVVVGGKIKPPINSNGVGVLVAAFYHF